MPNRIVVIGGGLAGLAAAEALSARGFSVLLLESRPRLGGRATSFEDHVTGEIVDNCQHVTMSCCTNFEQFCARAGLDSLLRTEPRLNFIGLDQRSNEMTASSLPAPFHLMGSFNRLSFLTREDRWALARGLSQLARADEASLHNLRFDTWLAQHHQTENTLNRFWHVVLVSALSESLDRIDAAHARKVFVDGFLANREGWQVRMPTVPLDELYGQTLQNYLRGQGVEIRQGAGVRALEIEDNRITSAQLRTGERIEADEFILAVPHYRIKDLLPPSLSADPGIQNLDRLETSPITSVHFWFDRPFMNEPHAVLVDRLAQWIFNRTLLSSIPRKPESGYYYQVVISASRELDDLSAEETIETLRRELELIWPAAREAKLLHSRRVTERRAVFSVTPGCEQWRLPQQSPLPNLQFAGDWTKTGWPATMEGAVRSGYLAAENILARHGKPANILAPDLPIATLSKWLWGLKPSNGYPSQPT